MRKLHKTALVAAMIGSLCMAGAGIASAGDDGPSRQCLQGAEQGDSNLQVGLINLNDVPLLGSLTKQNVSQQSCVNGDDSATFTGSSVESSSNGNGLLNGLLGGVGG
ncbi:hypothetical protein OHS71_24040 [Streptomyces sp. NBC_00377]|uniref:hypothetical protein n=1 Tax=unclassified Streptomyces TaxID=2593676 RepID=UPI002E1FFDA7|nr:MULTISPECIES: hypothetical protein [unclassified Streptomyces]